VLSADAFQSTLVPKQSYTYDNFGNLANVTTAGSGLTTMGVNTSSNRVTSVTAAGASTTTGYDQRGNMTRYGSASYTYDALNMLTRSTFDNATRYYIYSASDERIGTIEVSAAGTRSEWTIRDAAGQVLRRFSKESTGDWKWQEDYIYRGSQMLAAEVPDSTKTRHFHLDHLGTPRLITGNGGVELSRHNYHPFGVEIMSTSTSSTVTTREKKQFTGHERDAESLDYMHTRFYAPYMGRFLSVDPVLTKSAMRSPQLWNRYAYVGNDPMVRTDPTGKDIVLQGCQNGGGNSQACKDQTAIAQQAFGKAWSSVNNNNGVLTLKSGVSPAMLGSKFGVAARALGFMANSKDHFNMITGPVAAAMAKDFGGGRTVANTGGGANIYIDTARFPQRLGMANMGAAEVFVHETGHAIEPYFAGIQAINAKYGMTGPAGQESFSVFVENAYRRQELGLPSNDIRVFYKTPGDIRYEGTHLEDIWP
jgi:RHS repeat-associated protein